MIHNPILDEKIHVVIQSIVGSNVHLSLVFKKGYVKYEFCRYFRRFCCKYKPRICHNWRPLDGVDIGNTPSGSCPP